MNDWKKFNEASLPEKEEFFNDRNFFFFQDFYVQSDTLLQAVVFSNFRNMCLEIHEFDPANFLYALRLAWQAAL